MDEYLKKRNGPTTISLLEEGFQIHNPKGKAILVPWAAINSINAFQVNLWASESISVEFYQDDGSRIEINDQMEGYQAIMELVRNKFKGFDRDWYEKVAFPPLESNFRELWKRT